MRHEKEKIDWGYVAFWLFWGLFGLGFWSGAIWAVGHFGFKAW